MNTIHSLFIFLWFLWVCVQLSAIVTYLNLCDTHTVRTQDCPFICMYVTVAMNHLSFFLTESDPFFFLWMCFWGQVSLYFVDNLLLIRFHMSSQVLPLQAYAIPPDLCSVEDQAPGFMHDTQALCQLNYMYISFYTLCWHLWCVWNLRYKVWNLGKVSWCAIHVQFFMYYWGKLLLPQNSSYSIIKNLFMAKRDDLVVKSTDWAQLVEARVLRTAAPIPAGARPETASVQVPFSTNGTGKPNFQCPEQNHRRPGVCARWSYTNGIQPAQRLPAP